MVSFVVPFLNEKQIIYQQSNILTRLHTYKRELYLILLLEANLKPGTANDPNGRTGFAPNLFSLTNTSD